MSLNYWYNSALQFGGAFIPVLATTYIAVFLLATLHSRDAPASFIRAFGAFMLLIGASVFIYCRTLSPYIIEALSFFLCLWYVSFGWRVYVCCLVVALAVPFVAENLATPLYWSLFFFSGLTILILRGFIAHTSASSAHFRTYGSLCVVLALLQSLVYIRSPVDFLLHLVLLLLVYSVVAFCLVGVLSKCEEVSRLSDRHTATERLMRQLIDLVSIAMYIKDADGRLLLANRAVARILGYPTGESIEGKVLHELPGLTAEQKRMLNSFVQHDNRIILGGKPECFEEEYEYGGEVHTFISTKVPIELYGKDAVVGASTDITELKRMQHELHRIAVTDELTGLLDRRGFRHSVEALSGLPESRQAPACILYVDVDQFKVINDTAGHAAGDEILCALARIFERNTRAGDIVARIGGDEFSIILNGCRLQAAGKIGEKIRAAVEQYGHSRYEGSCTVSIGCIEIDRNLAFDALMRKADVAMYLAKNGGKNRVVTTTASDEDARDVHQDMLWSVRLRDVLHQPGLLRLYRQRVRPLDVAENAPQGVFYELLLRLYDPQYDRLIMPSAFLPAAERFGVMKDLDRWVVARVCRAIREGQVESTALYSVNLSGQFLNLASCRTWLLEELGKLGVRSQSLAFEITETEALQNLEEVRELIVGLLNLGCRVLLDDFGVGFTSFAYLKELPVHAIKIDGSFIRNLRRDSPEYFIVQALRDIADCFGVSTVAEFIETAEALVLLRELGVNFGQGYYIHEPEPFIID